MFLYAVKAVKSGGYPSTYQDMYNGDNLHITFAAAAGKQNTWTNYAPLQGNFNNDEEISGTAGESATLVAEHATGFEIKGTKGPNRGIMQVYVDGVSQGVFTLTDTNWSQRASLFKSGTLPAGTHSLNIVNVSTNASAASVGIDEIIVSKAR